MHRAIHRLGVVILSRLRDVPLGIPFLIQLHRREHAILVKIEVAGLLEQISLGQMRSVEEGISSFDVTPPRVLLHFIADDTAVRMEDRET